MVLEGTGAGDKERWLIFASVLFVSGIGLF